MAFVWNSFSSAGRSKFMWNGMLNSNPIHDAVIRDCVNSMFPMAYEQRSWCYNVFVIFCIRCCFTYVRIQAFNVSVLSTARKEQTQIQR